MLHLVYYLTRCILVCDKQKYFTRTKFSYENIINIFVRHPNITYWYFLITSENKISSYFFKITIGCVLSSLESLERRLC